MLAGSRVEIRRGDGIRLHGLGDPGGGKVTATPNPSLPPVSTSRSQLCPTDRCSMPTSSPVHTLSGFSPVQTATNIRLRPWSSMSAATRISPIAPCVPCGFMEGFPVPGMEVTSDTVEGIWQGLKVIRGFDRPAVYFAGPGKKRGGKPEWPPVRRKTAEDR